MNQAIITQFLSSDSPNILVFGEVRFVGKFGQNDPEQRHWIIGV